MPLIVLGLLMVSSLQPSQATTNGSSVQVENVYDYIARTFPQICPYEPLCHQTAKKTASGDMGSCCLPCSCREHCHLLSNCCPDKRPITVTESPTEKMPSADMFKCVSVNIGKISYPKYYNMVYKCPPSTATQDPALECEDENKHIVSDMTPITDLDSGISYRNSYCARCHGVTQSKPWTIYFLCGVNFLQIARAGLTSVTSLRESAQCSVKFSPPDAINVESDQCYRDSDFYICNRTGTWRHEESSELTLTKKACEMWRAPYYDRGNVYCSLCNGVPLSGLEQCRDREKEVLPTHVFTAILEYGSDFPDNDPDEGKDPDEGRRDKAGICQAGKIMDTHMGTCRSFVCPQFKYLLNGHCENILTNYNHMNILLVLKLVTDDMEFIENETVNSKAVVARNYLEFLTNGRRDLSASLRHLAETKAGFPGMPYLTAIATMSTQVVPEPDILQWIFDRLGQSFAYTNPDGHAFIFEVSLNARIQVSFLDYNKKMFLGVSSISEAILTDLSADSTLQSLLYHPVQLQGFAGLIFSRLLFCQQIRLNRSEYEDFGMSIVVLATNTTLYTFEFIKNTATSEVNVCVEDYLPEASSGRHADDPSAFRPELVYALVLVIAFSLVTVVLVGAIYRHRRLSRPSPSST